MARLPKPTAIKEIQGTIRKDRVLSNEPKPKTDVSEIEIPQDLSVGAKEFWKFAVSNMPKGVITGLDVAIFMRWCSLMDDFNRVQLRINNDGLLGYDDAGNSKINNLISIKLKLSTAIKDLEKELGFTPSSRTRVGTVGQKEENTNPFLDL